MGFARSAEQIAIMDARRGQILLAKFVVVIKWPVNQDSTALQ